MTTKAERVYPLWRKTTPVRVDLPTLRLAEGRVDSCEGCMPEQAETPFEFVLDQLTGCDPESTDYILPETCHCPRCAAPLRTGFWRWYSSEEEGRKVFILPGTLVNLKKD